MSLSENFNIKDLMELKSSYKQQKLKRREITDKCLQEVLDRLSVEERYRFLYYYIINDVWKKLDS